MDEYIGVTGKLNIYSQTLKTMSADVNRINGNMIDAVNKSQTHRELVVSL